MTASSSNTIPVRRRTRSFAQTGHTATARCTTISPLRNTSPMPRPSGSAAVWTARCARTRTWRACILSPRSRGCITARSSSPGRRGIQPAHHLGRVCARRRGPPANAGDAARPPCARRRQPYRKVLRRAARRAHRPHRGHALIHSIAGAGETISPAPAFLCRNRKRGFTNAPFSGTKVYSRIRVFCHTEGQNGP